jgi:hypothetical protein
MVELSLNFGDILLLKANIEFQEVILRLCVIDGFMQLSPFIHQLFYILFAGYVVAFHKISHGPSLSILMIDSSLKLYFFFLQYS